MKITLVNQSIYEKHNHNYKLNNNPFKFLLKKKTTKYIQQNSIENKQYLKFK